MQDELTTRDMLRSAARDIESAETTLNFLGHANLVRELREVETKILRLALDGKNEVVAHR